MCIAFALLSGCGESSPQSSPVSGTITYQGKSLESGTIIFVPDESKGTHGPIAHSRIQANGTYLLRTEEGLNVPPGWYRVTIASPLSLTSQSLQLPHHYRDPEMSDQFCEVKAGQKNQIDFHLQ